MTASRFRDPITGVWHPVAGMGPVGPSGPTGPAGPPGPTGVFAQPDPPTEDGALVWVDIDDEVSGGGPPGPTGPPGPPGVGRTVMIGAPSAPVEGDVLITDPVGTVITPADAFPQSHRWTWAAGGYNTGGAITTVTGTAINVAYYPNAVNQLAGVAYSELVPGRIYRFTVTLTASVDSPAIRLARPGLNESLPTLVKSTPVTLSMVFVHRAGESTMLGVLGGQMTGPGGSVLVSALRIEDLTSTARTTHHYDSVLGWVPVVDTTRVSRSGDQMSGNLSVVPSSGPARVSALSSTSNAQIVLDGAKDAAVAAVDLHASGAARWSLYRTSAPETGANAGSDLAISRYADNGAALGTALSVVRSTGEVRVPATPITDQGVVNKAYLEGVAWARLSRTDQSIPASTWTQVGGWTLERFGAISLSGNSVIVPPGVYLVTSRVRPSAAGRVILSVDANDATYGGPSSWLSDARAAAAEDLVAGNRVLFTAGVLRFWAYTTPALVCDALIEITWVGGRAAA